MKYFKSKATFVLSVVLLSLAVVGTTLALLIALVPAIRNFFFPANVSCAVQVTYDEENDKWNATITNDGDVDAYVRVAIVPYLTEEGGEIFWQTPVYTLETTLNAESAANWIEFGDHNYYYFNGVLKKSASVDLGDITIDHTGSGDYSYTVEKLDVLAEAFQVGSEEALADAWGVTYAEGAFAEAGVCTHTGTLVYENEGNEYHKYSCEACGFVYGFVRHNMKATDNGNGTHSGRCTDCDYVADATPHTLTYTKIDGSTHTALCSMCKWTETQTCTYDVVEKVDGDYHRTACKCGATQSSVAHDFTYKDNGDGTHSQWCEACEYVKSAAKHTPIITNNGDGATHRSTCTGCGYAFDVEHTLKNVSVDASTHAPTCDICGYAGDATDHTFAYTDHGDGTHIKTCSDGCGYRASADHKLQYADNGDGTHTVTCQDNCGYTESEAHIPQYVTAGDEGHTVTCQNSCGYTANEAHTPQYTSNGESGHRVECSKTGCEYGFNVVHTITYNTTADTHTAKCDICGYTGGATAHDDVTYEKTDTTHTAMCNTCGYVGAATAHTKTNYVSNGSSGHTWTCSVCQKSVTEAHDGNATCGVCGYVALTYQKQFSMLSEDMQPTLTDNNGYVWEETVFLIDDNATYGTKTLLYPIKNIIEVKYIDPNSGEVTYYEQGTHYSVNNEGQIVFVEGSGVVNLGGIANYEGAGDQQNSGNTGTSATYWGEGNTMIKNQIRITYTYDTSNTWGGTEQTSYSSQYTSFINKLKRGQDVTVIFYGDSITWGSNAAFNIGYQPNDGYSYSLLFTQALADLFDYNIDYVSSNLQTNVYGAIQQPSPIPADKTTGSNGTITYINTAVGGWMSTDGANNVGSYVADFITAHGCDLFVVAFGMNDANGQGSTTKTNVQTILNSVNSKAGSDVAKLVVSSMIPAENYVNYGSINTAAQRTALLDLVNNGGYTNIGLADMTTISTEIHARKGLFADSSGNNVNHPNDFLHRMYAQTLLETVIGYENIESVLNSEVPDDTATLINSRLDAHTIDGVDKTGDISIAAGQTVGLRGWIGFDKAISMYGYALNGGQIVWTDEPGDTTEPGVLQAGGQYAKRYHIQAPTYTLGVGAHTITYYVKLTNGYVHSLGSLTPTVTQALSIVDNTTLTSLFSLDGFTTNGNTGVLFPIAQFNVASGTVVDIPSNTSAGLWGWSQYAGGVTLVDVGYYWDNDLSTLTWHGSLGTAVTDVTGRFHANAPMSSAPSTGRHTLCYVGRLSNGKIVRFESWVMNIMAS